MNCNRYLDWNPRLRKYPERLWPQEWQEHIRDCPECRFHHKMAAMLAEDFEVSSDIEVPPRFAESVMTSLAPRQSKFNAWTLRLQGVAIVLAVVVGYLSFQPVMGKWGLSALQWFWAGVRFLWQSWALLGLKTPAVGSLPWTYLIPVALAICTALLGFTGAAIWWLVKMERTEPAEE
jgi:hypothetical protein